METYDDLTVTDPAEALRYILKKNIIPGNGTSSQRMPASSTKLPKNALKIVPLAKNNYFGKIGDENSIKMKVAEKMGDEPMEESHNVPEPTIPEQTFLVNNNKSLKSFQSVSKKPSQKSSSSEDTILDLSIGSRSKSLEKEKASSSQSSDNGWDFLEKPC